MRRQKSAPQPSPQGAPQFEYRDSRVRDPSTVRVCISCTLCGPPQPGFGRFIGRFRHGMGELPVCAYPRPLLASRTCDVPAPPGAPAATTVGTVIRVVKRQAPVFVIALAAACAAPRTGAGAPSMGAKRAQAEEVLAEIQQLDSNLERARTLYIASTQKLHVIEHNLKINKIALRAARANLKRSQHTLMQRLVTIYTTRDDQSTLAVLLGATSIDDLVNRIETVQSVSAQDIAVLHEVVGFKKDVTRSRHALTVAHRSQQHLVQQRAAAKARISSQLSRSRALLSSIRGQIAHILAVNRARALAAANAARARYDAAA